VLLGALLSGCSTLLGPDATPVPGAAATLTRSINTPIPTPVRTASVVPSPSARTALASPSPSAVADLSISDADIASVESRFEQIVASPNLAGIDAVLLDHISLSTPQGGSVMSEADAASWLRDHAGPNIKVSQVSAGRQDLMLQVMTDGWPQKDPIQAGQVNFSLRRYDANGRQDESGGGDWKVDVIDAE
jgi:hypothetical protein